MKKKVLHVINSMTIGGAETLLAHSLAPGGLCEHTENWLVYLKGDTHLTALVDKSVQQVCLDYKGGLDLLRVLKKLKKIIKENHIDIIHSHLTPVNVYANLVRPGKVRQVHTIHTTYSMDTETRPFLLLLEKQLYFSNKQNSVICLSDYTKIDFLKTVPFKGKTFVLNNFAADNFFSTGARHYNPGKPALKLVAAGGLRTIKNFEYLLKVFSQLVDEEIYLDIYGNGNKEHYENTIRKGGLKVRMMGPHPDMASALGEYDLFIMPSKFEGFPISLFEAMASGLPAMVSDIAPLRDIVKDNALFFGLDNAEATADMIKSVRTGRIDINALAEKGKKHAEQTARRNIYVNKLLDIYEQL